MLFKRYRKATCTSFSNTKSKFETYSQLVLKTLASVALVLGTTRYDASAIPNGIPTLRQNGFESLVQCTRPSYPSMLMPKGSENQKKKILLCGK